MADTRTRHELPNVRDGWTFLHAQKCTISRDRHCVVLGYGEIEIAVPSAPLLVLLLGPGTTLTHAAMTLIADTGCTIVWTGEKGVRCYASAASSRRPARNLEHQARMWADESTRLEVVYRLYRMRFDEHLPEAWTLQQIRGREGVRVREAYAVAARSAGIEWKGRQYRRDDWGSADPVNRALSTANACLYGVVHAALLATGFSPALGFIHTGYGLSFVHDVADLYKVDLTVPIAFEQAAAGAEQLETRVRKACREKFFENRILERIVPDVQRALGLTPEPVEERDPQDELFGGLWDIGAGVVELGVNWSPDAPS